MILSCFAKQIQNTHIYAVMEYYNEQPTALFSQKKDAEQLADLLNRQNYKPEEYQKLKEEDENSLYVTVIALPLNPLLPAITLPIWEVVITDNGNMWSYLKEVSYETLISETFPQTSVNKGKHYVWTGPATTEQEARELALQTKEEYIPQINFDSSTEHQEHLITPSVYVEEIDHTVYISPSGPQEEAVKYFGEIGQHADMWIAVPEEDKESNHLTSVDSSTIIRNMVYELLKEPTLLKDFLRYMEHKYRYIPDDIYHNFNILHEKGVISYTMGNTSLLFITHIRQLSENDPECCIQKEIWQNILFDGPQSSDELIKTINDIFEFQDEKVIKNTIWIMVSQDILVLTKDRTLNLWFLQ